MKVKTVGKIISITALLCCMCILPCLAASYKNGQNTKVTVSEVWAFHGGRKKGEKSSTSNGGNRSNHYNNRLYWYNGYSIDMLQMKGSQYKGKTYFYCIKMWEAYNDNTRKFYTDPEGKGDLTNSHYWQSLSWEKQRLLALASMYGFPAKTPSQLGVSTADDAYAATQAIIWEIVTGRRTQSGLKSRFTSDSFERKHGFSVAKNNPRYFYKYYMHYAYTGNGHKKGKATPALTAYKKIESAIKKHDTLASFHKNTFTLNWDGKTRKYVGSITDKNGVLSDSRITGSLPSGVTYKKRGNTITFYSTKPITSRKNIRFNKNLPSMWQTTPLAVMETVGGKPGQEMLCGVVNDPRPFYMYIKTSSGTLSVKKTAEDKVISGLKFKITGNGVDKTITTDKNGQVKTTLGAGTYTVKETSVPSRYEIPSSRKVTVNGGKTSNVNFHNMLKQKVITIKKTSEDGQVSGRKFRIKGDRTNITLTTGSNGSMTATVPVGDYTVTEIDTPSKYVQPPSQKITLSPDLNKTKTIKFHNEIKKARVKFVKKCSFYDGYLTGAKYRIYKADGTYTGYEITSDAEYWVYSPLLVYGDYYLQESTPPEFYAKDNTKYHFSVRDDGKHVPVTVYNAPKGDVYPEYTSPHTDYIAGTEIIVSYRIHNDSLAEWTPKRPLKVKFNAYDVTNGKNVKLTSKDVDVISPFFAYNLAYFKVKLPETAEQVKFSCHVVSPDGIMESNKGNNTEVKTFPVKKYITFETPNTKFEETPPYFHKPVDTAVVPTGGKTPIEVATWQQWAYENGKFIKKTYGVELKTKQEVLPDVNSLSHYFSQGTWHMRSGYGFSISAVSQISKLDGCLPPDMYTLPQHGNVYFPEFGYKYEQGKYRTLELTSPDTMEFLKNPYTMTKKGVPDYRRIHFTPLWFPDGKYVVKTYLSGCWTPAGMLSTAQTLKPLMIEEDMYFDWYINHSDKHE